MEQDKTMAVGVPAGVATGGVMTMLRKVSDFVYFLPFLFSLYHYPEHSGMFYDSPYFSTVMHDPAQSSMT